MRASPKFTEHSQALETIINMMETGADLTLHLSKKAKIAHIPGADRKQPGSCDDRDLLLGEWGVYHLHLATEHANDLIFAMFTRTDAYLIGAYDHRSWGLTEVLKTVVRNWSNAGLEADRFTVRLLRGRRTRPAKARTSKTRSVFGSVSTRHKSRNPALLLRGLHPKRGVCTAVLLNKGMHGRSLAIR